MKTGTFVPGAYWVVVFRKGLLILELAWIPNPVYTMAFDSFASLPNFVNFFLHLFFFWVCQRYCFFLVIKDFYLVPLRKR